METGNKAKRSRISPSFGSRLLQLMCIAEKDNEGEVNFGLRERGVK
jgi:hypothetical protein